MKSSRPLCASHISMPPLLRSLDVVLELLCFLDAGSIVRLSMTCKRLYRELNGSRYIWLRTIRKSCEDECLPPRSLESQLLQADSLPEAGRIARLREIATRPFRLRGGFQRMNPSAPHHLSPGRPGGVNNFGSTVAHGGIPMAFTRFKLVYGQDWTELRRLPLLFPGGRYMLTTGSFRDFMDAIFFWDLSDVKQGEGILANSIHPIAKVEVREKKDVSGLDLKVQYDPLSEQVVVLAHFCDYPNHQSVFRIYHLSWPSAAGFTLTATLHLPRFEGPHDEVMEGDYVCIHSVESICLWNWRARTWAIIDPEEHQQSWASGLGFELWLRPPYIFTIPSSCDQIVALEFPNLQPTKSPIQTLTAQSHTFEISLTGLNLLEHTPHPETGHVFNYSPIDHWISYNDAKQLSLRRRVLGQLDFIPSFNSPPIYVVIDSTDDVPRVIYRCSENRMRSNRSFVVPIDRVTGNDSGTDTFICVAGDFATPAPQVSRRIAAAVAVVDDAMNPPQGAVQVAVNAGLDLREGVVEMGYQPLYASLWTKKEDDRVFGEKSSLEQELKVGRTSPGPSKMSTSSLFPTPSQFAVSDTPSSQSSSSHSSSSPDPRDLGYNMTQAQFAFDGGSTKQGIVHGGPCPISGRMIVEIREPFQYALLEFD